MKTVYKLLLHHSNKFSINFNQWENSILELENAQAHILIPSPAAKIWRKHLFVVWFGLPARPNSFLYSQHFPHSKWILVRSNTDRRVSRQILSPPIPCGSVSDLTNIAYQFEMRISGECVSVRITKQVEKCGSTGRECVSVWNVDQSSVHELDIWCSPSPYRKWQSDRVFFREINGKKGKNILYSIILKYWFLGFSSNILETNIWPAGWSDRVRS